MAAFNVEQFQEKSVYLKGTDMYYDGLYYNLEAASTILVRKRAFVGMGDYVFDGAFQLYIVRSLPVDSYLSL